MSDFSQAFADALGLLQQADSGLIEIVVLSLQVSGSAVLLAALIGLPLGALIAIGRFPGRGVLSVIVNGFMGLPPVVVGLMVFLMLSRSGPLGVLGLLYTPSAMIVAQAILVTPILAAYTAEVVRAEATRLMPSLTAMGLGRGQAARTLLYEGRYALVTGMLAGFGRAIAEVGAVMIVGGNIDHATRTMTTAIALETGRGNLALALALGMVLIALTLIVNALAGGIFGPLRQRA
ncbi:MAG: ABC transporter permease [Alphaproteobacteria bacterium]